MKTFNSATSKLDLRVVRTNEDLVRFNIGTAHEAFASIDISPESIPALALAELEAAGYTEGSNNFGTAVHELGLAIKEQRYIAAEAKEQAELEAEALALFNTLQTEIHGTLGPNWAHVTEFPSGETKRKWLAVARKAREMRSESNGNV